VVVASDKFKGTMSAADATDAMCRGVLNAYPDARVTKVPLADGGDGTIDVLVATGRARRELVRMENFDAPVARLADGSACIEVATTSGCAPQQDALHASSRRTGDAMRALFAEQPMRVLVAVGGSASTDGGVGLAQALGWRFADSEGRAVGPGELEGLRSIDGRDRTAPPCPVVGLCDVANPLLGAGGAARTFGPQKGASRVEVETLERGLTSLAEIVRLETGVELADRPHAGAGGGIGAGLIAFCGADLIDGFGFVAETVGLEEAIANADLVITGEGRLDRGSLAGKVTGGVARLARKARVSALAVCGEVALSSEETAQLGFAATVGAPSFDFPRETIELATQGLMEEWRA
jgi:glycerate kinase